jgi:hypothetical protein
MGNGLNVRRVTAYQVRHARKSQHTKSVQKVVLSVPKSRYAKAGSVALTKKSLKRVTVMADHTEAVRKVLESADANSTEARNIVVFQHQLQSLKSNPTANTSLTKKQMKKLRIRAKCSGLLVKPKQNMEI